jgi:AcrR family transcriptional regulator
MAQPKKRADSIRNRASILASAEALFSAGGIEVPMERVAEHAGLGMGTLYRHFPSKDALLEAVVAHRLGMLALALEAEMDIETMGVSAFILRLADEFGSKHTLIRNMSGSGVQFDARALPEMCQFLLSLEKAVAGACARGVLRDGVTGDDLLAVAIAVCQSVKGERLLELATEGLRPMRPDLRRRSSPPPKRWRAPGANRGRK